MKARVTKAKRLKIGAAGLLYCNETHSFTTPFLVSTEPDPDRVVTEIWPERWRLPFGIHPLGDPYRQLSSKEAKRNWRILQGVGAGGVSAAMNITGTTVFVPKEIEMEDWSSILGSLATL